MLLQAFCFEVLFGVFKPCRASWLVSFLFSLKAEFATQVTKIHEQVREREQELIGGWYTEERMHTDLSYSKPLA